MFSKENSQAYFIHLLSQQPFYWALINLLDNVPGIWATDMFDIQLFPQGSRYLEKQTCKGISNGKGAVGEERKDSFFFFFKPAWNVDFRFREGFREKAILTWVI